MEIEINKKQIYSQQRLDNAIDTSQSFMSNLYQLDVPIIDDNKLEYWNSEGYYMAQRTSHIDVKKLISEMSKKGGKASRNARNLFTLEMSEKLRVMFMVNAVIAKFVANPKLIELLLATEQKEIIEKSYWKDDFFGVRTDTLKGANVLGRILMDLRSQYIEHLFKI